MRDPYPKTPSPVKAHYTIRMDGSVWRIRATHIEVLNFLRRLYAARRAA